MQNETLEFEENLNQKYPREELQEIINLINNVENSEVLSRIHLIIKYML
ncbi:hypothetical protein [Bacillus thuringiensis]